MNRKPEEQIVRDLERYAQDYSALQFEEIQEDFRRVELVAAIESISPEYLVEVGCGRNSVIGKLRGLKQATIIEPIKELLDANLETLKDHAEINGFNGYLNQFITEFEDTYDLCVLSSLLHEVNDQNEMLIDCSKLLNSNGILIVNVPNAFSIHRILGVYMDKLESVFSLTETQLTMQQINAPFSPETLKVILQNNGFHVEKVFTVIPKLLDHKNLSEIVESGLVDRTFLTGLNRLSGHLDGFGSEIIAIARKNV